MPAAQGGTLVLAKDHTNMVSTAAANPIESPNGLEGRSLARVRGETENGATSATHCVPRGYVAPERESGARHSIIGSIGCSSSGVPSDLQGRPDGIHVGVCSRPGVMCHFQSAGSSRDRGTDEVYTRRPHVFYLCGVMSFPSFSMVGCAFTTVIYVRVSSVAKPVNLEIPACTFQG